MTVEQKKKSSKTKHTRLVLIDAHALLHRAYHALPGFTSPTGEPTGALYGLASMLLKIVSELKPDYLAAAYDLPKPTYRHEAYADYKAGREKTEEELVSQIKRSRDVFGAFSIPIYECEGFEADDVLGTIVEQVKNQPVDTIIASGDMDTMQLVDGTRVKVYTLRKGMNDTVLYDEDAVVTRFGFSPTSLPDFKGLRGDPSDNIIGIRGVGEKTATALVAAYGSIESMYRALRKGSGVTEKVKLSPRMIELLREGEDDAKFSKILATIRRDVPIQFVLPETTWREHISVTQITDLFSELGFRSLIPRVKAELGRGDDSKPEALPLSISDSISPEQLAEAKIGLWLLNSDTTNPSEDDVRAYTKSGSLEEARTAILGDLKKQGLWKVFDEVERPLIPVVEAMIARGIAVDVPFLSDLSKNYHAELSSLERRIWERAGTEFNINSPRQLGDILFERLGLKGGKKTATGQRSTREAELAKLSHTHPIINEILEYRELQKLLSTYIDAFPVLLAADKRLHTTFVQTGTTTGRMSSQNPNLQNIPIKTDLGKAVRAAFIAAPGKVLVSLDYSQIELRIAAILSGDEKLVQTFVGGGDIHTTVAAEIFNVSEDAVTAQMRRTAKVINFGIIYGMGANALAATAEISRSEAQEYLADFERTFTGLSAYIERVQKEARKRGYTETLFGRRRQLPTLSSALPHLQAEALRQAINAPIQGTSADIIKIAMCRIDTMLRKTGKENSAGLVLQIHDELMYEVVEDLAEELSEEFATIMETVVPPEMSRGVPIVAERAIGKRWSELEKRPRRT